MSLPRQTDPGGSTLYRLGPMSTLVQRIENPPKHCGGFFMTEFRGVTKIEYRTKGFTMFYFPVRRTSTPLYLRDLSTPSGPFRRY